MGSKHTKQKNEFRKNNKKYRNERRKENYKKSRPATRKHVPWEDWQLRAVMGNQGIVSDSLIAILIKRSVQAIQQKRYQVKKNV